MASVAECRQLPLNCRCHAIAMFRTSEYAALLAEEKILLPHYERHDGYGHNIITMSTEYER